MAPGLDGLTVSLLDMVWDLIESRVTGVYDSCLGIGYYPPVFKTREVAMIQTRQDQLPTFRSYRPIALIKGLERLVARQMLDTALLKGLLQPPTLQVFQKRSAVDLTTALNHDIEEALNRNLEATS